MLHTLFTLRIQKSQCSAGGDLAAFSANVSAPLSQVKGHCTQICIYVTNKTGATKECGGYFY